MMCSRVQIGKLVVQYLNNSVITSGAASDADITSRLAIYPLAS